MLPPPVFRMIRTVPLDTGAAEMRDVRRERAMMVVFMAILEVANLRDWICRKGMLLGY